ncbi:hypothetical protein V2J09_016453 [Rumex salicifolius]
MSSTSPPTSDDDRVHICQDRWLPDFRQSVKLKYVKLGYHYLITHLFKLSVLPLTWFLLLQAYHIQYDDVYTLGLRLQHHLVTVLACTVLAVFGLSYYFVNRAGRPVYLVDYSCYCPRPALRVSFRNFVEHARAMDVYDDSCLDFQRKVLERSGLGDDTVFPPAMHSVPYQPSMADARAEAEEVIFGALDCLFKATRVDPKDIGMLVVNSSLFNPTPSLSAMVVNKYKMRENIRSFNLGGMGCSTGVHRNTYAVVVSTEIISQSGYTGNQKSMMVTNCLFRVGGAAILLSNRSSEKRRAKYKLAHVVRTHRGAQDKAYGCVYQEQDEAGKSGVSLSKDLMAIAGDALKTNITTLGPLVLPMSEQLLFLFTLVGKKLFNSKTKPYIPNFKLAFEHFCIHAGGRAVIDELEKNLELSKDHVEASRMTLHRFGNTSSSSIWYELGYIEAKGRMRKGNRVWQIAFGSGFKCNSAVWVALRNVKASKNSPWLDCIDKYPIY